ncbi:BQ5605_C028g10466 [Microbotryum silenes-dioicae]|uniref:BQ5605_C028g10466 protein n=1 Tax=Microbotryum silenes-dioicae TaxID=796604 RepID=A0A2X0NBA2_9BASI|nr:BQ5605_C028g10466 [Microbotryum silenes-dioicae]
MTQMDGAYADEKAVVEHIDEIAELESSIDATAERKLVMKLDLWILPLVTLMFLLNFIDRSAVGNANVAGLSKDLKLVDYEYNISLMIFYVAYVLVEPFSNLALKKVGGMWLSALVVMFGVITIGSAFVKNYHEFLAVRVLLGLAEGGAIPGIAFVLGRFYRRHELVLRIGIFLALGPSLSGAFGGLLAGALIKQTIGSVKGWRCIFLVEGIITTAVGAMSFFLIPTSPETARFLNEAECALAVKRVAIEQLGAQKDKTNSKSLKHGLSNTLTWLCCLGYSFINIQVQGAALFLPTVIRTLGKFTPVEVQLRSVPPYVLATFWSIFISWLCQRTRKHGIWIAFTCCFSTIGYILFLTVHNNKVLYFATFITYSGAVPCGPVFLSWAVANASPETSRAITSALVPAVGTWGSIVATWAYLPKYAPRYKPGNSLNVAAAVMPALIALGITAYCKWENKQRDEGKRDHRLEGLTEAEQVALGFKHPEFRYLI